MSSFSLPPLRLEPFPSPFPFSLFFPGDAGHVSHPTLRGLAIRSNGDRVPRAPCYCSPSEPLLRPSGHASAFSCRACAALVAFLAGPDGDRVEAGRGRLAAAPIHSPAIPRLPPSAQCTSTMELDHSLSTTDSALLPSEHVEGCEFLAPVRPWETLEGTRGTEALTTLSQKRAARH